MNSMDTPPKEKIDNMIEEINVYEFEENMTEKKEIELIELEIETNIVELSIINDELDE